MANEKNLKPFKKGNKAAVGKGRPKGVSPLTILKKLLQQKVTLKHEKTGQKETRTNEEWLALKYLTIGLRGSESAIKDIFDRIDGKSTTRMELTGKDGEPIKQSVELPATCTRIEDIIKRGAKAIDKASLPN